MTKRQIIDEIIEINSTAGAGFLATFGEDELTSYLARLQLLAQPRLTGDVSHYTRYFNTAPAPVAARTATVAKWHRVEAKPVRGDLVVAAEDSGPEPSPTAASSQGSLFSAMA